MDGDGWTCQSLVEADEDEDEDDGDDVITAVAGTHPFL